MTHLAMALAALVALADDKAPKAAEEKIAGPGSLTFVVRMQGPYDADVPLQVVCYFRPKEGRKPAGAAVELDKRLGGVIASLRDRGEFAGDSMETLVLDTKKAIPAKRLLLIGLGDDAELTLNRMERVGRTAYREAARLGATKAAFAPLIRDQGVEKLAAGDVARRVVRGLLLARDTDVRLQAEGLSDKFALTEWVMEAGPAYFKETVTGVRKGVAEASDATKKRKAAPFASRKD